MNDSTWVKLYRKSLANDVRRHGPTAWRLFETLLLLVDSRTGKWSGGRYQLVEADGSLNGSTIYKALQRLEVKGMVKVQSNTRYSEISICKWSHYTKVGNTSSNNEVTTNEQPSNTLTRSKKKEVRIDTKVSIVPENISVDKKAIVKAENTDYKDLLTYWSQLSGRNLMDSKASKNAYRELSQKGISKQDLAKAINGAVFFQGKQYKPQVQSFSSMLEKWDKLSGHIANQENKGVMSESNRF